MKNTADELTRAEQEALELDEHEDEIVPLRATPWILFLVGAIGYLPLAALLRLASFSAGGKWLVSFALDPVLYFAATWALIHLLLLRPITRFSLGQIGQFQRRAVRVTVMALLMAAPLLSYGYYRGGLKDLLAGHELFLAVLPAAIVGALALENTGRGWLSSLLLAVSLFVPFQLVNDILGDIPTYFKYASNGATFYALRTLGPLTGLVLCFVTLKSPPEEDRQWAELRWAGALLLGYGLAVSFGVPVWVALSEKVAWSTYFQLDWHWPVTLLTWLLLGAPAHRREFLRVVGAAEALLLTVQVLRTLALGQFTYWELSRVTYWGVLALFFGLVTYRVARPALPVTQS